MKNSCKI